jgi:hypothetical protein
MKKNKNTKQAKATKKADKRLNRLESYARIRDEARLDTLQELRTMVDASGYVQVSVLDHMIDEIRKPEVEPSN